MNNITTDTSAENHDQQAIIDQFLKKRKYYANLIFKIIMGLLLSIGVHVIFLVGTRQSWIPSLSLSLTVCCLMGALMYLWWYKYYGLSSDSPPIPLDIFKKAPSDIDTLIARISNVKIQ